MAGPIAHIICAFSLLQSGALQVIDEKAFIIGTVFPDIRYLNVIDREKTHKDNVQWEDVISASSSFEKGMLLHSLLDRVRIVHFEQPNEEIIPHIPMMRSQLLKFYEDRLIYNGLDNWNKIIEYFDEIIPEEKEWDISEKALKQWHRFIQGYCAQQPTPGSLFSCMRQLPQLQRHPSYAFFIRIYLELTFRLFKKKKLQKAIRSFYRNSNELLTSQAVNTIHQEKLTHT